MTLNGVIALILRFFSPNLIALQADYATVVGDRPIMSVKYCLPVPVFHFWPKLMHPAARSLCDSWATCFSIALIISRCFTFKCWQPGAWTSEGMVQRKCPDYTFTLQAEVTVASSESDAATRTPRITRRKLKVAPDGGTSQARRRLKLRRD